MKYIFRILKTDLFFEIFKFVVTFIFLINFVVLPLQKYCDESKAHLEIHNQGYEILDKKESYDRYGRPCFYYIVEYTDGCVEEMRVDPDVYYERVDE